MSEAVLEAPKPFVLYQFLGWNPRNPYKFPRYLPNAHETWEQIAAALPARQGRPPTGRGVARRVRKEISDPDFLAECRKAMLLPPYDPNHLLGPTDDYVTKAVLDFVAWYEGAFLTGE